MSQTSVFVLQESNTVDVAGQTIIEILQLNFLCNATMARWAAYNNIHGTSQTSKQMQRQNKSKPTERA